MLKDFRDFVLRGNVLDLAVGIVFGAIVNSLVKDIIMPPVGLLMGQGELSNLFWVIKEGPVIPRPYSTLGDAQAAGAVTFNYGTFLSTIIAFFIVAFSAFFVVHMMRRARKALEAKRVKVKVKAAVAANQAIKYCPYCAAAIDPKADRCPYCISPIKPP